MPSERLYLLELLFAGAEDTLIRSCLEGRLGEAYADSLDSPSAARLVAGGFVFFGGDAESPAAFSLVADRSVGGCILTPPNGAWAALIRRCYPDVKPETRYAFRKDTQFDRERLARLAMPPQGFSIRPIKRADYAEMLAAEWSRDFVSNFASAEEFERDGIGFIAMNDRGESVAGASSYSRYSTGIEVQVETREEHRRLGLATACSARLILGCLERGLYPSWDAANPTSVKLAEKLGYVLKCEYEVYEI